MCAKLDMHLYLCVYVCTRMHLHTLSLKRIARTHKHACGVHAVFRVSGKRVCVRVRACVRACVRALRKLVFGAYDELLFRLLHARA
jgi:hypothetical protein